jgi:hypothetical protein
MYMALDVKIFHSNKKDRYKPLQEELGCCFYLVAESKIFWHQLWLRLSKSLGSGAGSGSDFSFVEIKK